VVLRVAWTECVKLVICRGCVNLVGGKSLICDRFLKICNIYKDDHSKGRNASKHA